MLFQYTRSRPKSPADWDGWPFPEDRRRKKAPARRELAPAGGLFLFFEKKRNRKETFNSETSFRFIISQSVCHRAAIFRPPHWPWRSKVLFARFFFQEKAGGRVYPLVSLPGRNVTMFERVSNSLKFFLPAFSFKKKQGVASILLFCYRAKTSRCLKELVTA